MLCSLLLACVVGTDPPVVSGEKIWDRAPHCAFGDLLRWEDTFLCTFREGTRHVHGEDGKIRILASEDGRSWTSWALLEEAGIDLRDPKLSVRPDGSLMLSCGGSDYSDELLEWHTRVAFSKDGREWTPPRRVRGIPANNWFFRLTWQGEVGYAIPHLSPADPWTGRVVSDVRRLELYTTRDGMNYEKQPFVHELPPMACEVTLRFAPDEEMFAVVRVSGGQARSGFLLRATPPYAETRSVPIAHGFGGPNLLRLPRGEWILATREYAFERPAGREGTATVLLHLREDGTHARLFELESGGDTSYAGMLLHEGELWVSYYSSHEGSAAIYLSRIPVGRIEERIEATR